MKKSLILKEVYNALDADLREAILRINAEVFENRNFNPEVADRLEMASAALDKWRKGNMIKIMQSMYTQALKDEGDTYESF